MFFVCLFFIYFFCCCCCYFCFFLSLKGFHSSRYFYLYSFVSLSPFFFICFFSYILPPNFFFFLHFFVSLCHDVLFIDFICWLLFFVICRFSFYILNSFFKMHLRYLHVLLISTSVSIKSTANRRKDEDSELKMPSALPPLLFRCPAIFWSDTSRLNECQTPILLSTDRKTILLAEPNYFLNNKDKLEERNGEKPGWKELESYLNWTKTWSNCR